MPKSNIYDEAKQSLAQTILDIQGSIAEDFKGSKSYEAPEVPVDQLYMNFVQMNDAEKQFLSNKHGEKWVDFLYKMKKYEERRGLR